MESFKLFISSLLLFFASTHETNCDSVTNPDEIISLPGLTKTPNFKQYSGYLNAAPDGDKKLHYWFVESQNNATADPLLLWLNGGPGCSSLDGLLSENGPFQEATQDSSRNPDHVIVNGHRRNFAFSRAGIKVGGGHGHLALVWSEGAGLTPNPYSWNRFANVLYLESPAGVGFSYAVSKNLTAGDDITAVENYQALVNFFQKYPQFLPNDFYITGESYAGIYIPTLAVRILDGFQNFTLKGLAIGNGYYSRPINLNSMVYYGYQHGIIGHLIWEDLQKQCCTPTYCNFYNVTGNCKSQVDRALHFVLDIGLNTYAIYRDCAGGIPKGSTSLKRFLFDLSTITGNKTLLKPKMMPHYHKMEQISVGSPYHSMYIQKEDVLDCIDTTAETTYLNRADVRKALHIPPDVQDWSVCSEDVKDNYTHDYEDMYAQFRLIVGQFPILLYNGDTDTSCPINSASGFLAGLNLTITGDRRAWLYQNQVAGFVEERGPLTLMTVKGSGHMVPQWRPPQAFQMISNFINGKPQ